MHAQRHTEGAATIDTCCNRFSWETLTICFLVMLKRAIQQVIDDDSYHLNVEPAATALRQAKCIAEWSNQEENTAILNEFETYVVKELKGCVPHVANISSVKSFGSTCRNYHCLRTSTSFIELWSKFIKCITTDTHPQPTLYQEVSDIIFEEIIASALPFTTSPASEAAVITFDDSNVINYAAGFVCRKIYNTVNHSTRPEKAELLSCIKALLKEEGEEEAEYQSATCVNEVDRGGLWRVQEASGTYMLFAAMEEEVQEHFQVGAIEDAKRRIQRETINCCKQQ